MSDLDGRMGGLTAGYDIKAKWDGERLRGRVGGRFNGKDLERVYKGSDPVASLRCETQALLVGPDPSPV
ncbi:hypothetical protein [Deinococcus marmoris]|uniref:hypothetical protein n=1 Tax=Deinococcus marmoris TaxID=249408 RepID=UPI0009DE850E|nr:hypothetical protein [Deinococcus marmoris]